MTVEEGHKVTHFLQIIPLECLLKIINKGENREKSVNGDKMRYNNTVFCLAFCFSLQCQWAHVGGFLHSRTTAPFRIPNDVFWSVLAANLLYAATPILVALRVYSNPYFFLKIAPFPGQTGLPNSEEKDTKYKDK